MVRFPLPKLRRWEMRTHALQPGHILTGTLFSEPMRVETVRAHGPGVWEIGVVGVQSERFRKVTLTSQDIEALAIQDTLPTYAGDGRLLRLGLQAYMLGIAHEFDPYFGLSISRVDPLPHQLEAIYDYLLKLARVRFLLADDAGAGKTIMAGLLIRELKLRGLVERLLVVCPANLAFQWQRELKDKFDETFLVLKGSDIRDQFGVNQWLEHKQVITSLDLAKRDEILPGLRQVHWDLAIVDEAHRIWKKESVTAWSDSWRRSRWQGTPRRSTRRSPNCMVWRSRRTRWKRPAWRRSWRGSRNSSIPQLQAPIKDPARFPWHEVAQVQHYWLEVDTLTQPMQVWEDPAGYEGPEGNILERGPERG